MAIIDARIKRVARALCRADGKDPDSKERTNRTVSKETKTGWGTSISSEPELISVWQFYEKEATRFLMALDAASDD